MRKFMDEDFLLETETAKHLFHTYAENLPLVDYHCHISPREIYEDRRFNSIDEVWLGGRNDDGSYFGDHYKWRLMRSHGIPEEYITGDMPGDERIGKFAEALEMAIGNPMYHWTNLELKKYFGCDVPLAPENAKNVWEECSRKLREDGELSVRGLIRQSGVKFIGTTDDPADDLSWHKKIAGDPSIEVMVCPSFRPDKAININKAGFAEYIARLSEVSGMKIESAKDVKDVLTKRLEYFASLGCRASDHGLDYVPYREYTEEAADAVFRKVMEGEAITTGEAEVYETYILAGLAREYHRLGIVMQLHYSCYRNANDRIFKTMGPDTGVDMIAVTSCGTQIARLLSELDETGECPKTILYSLNPADDQQIDTLAGCFQTDEIPGKIQHGSAWWFNDTKSGMEAQMRSLANLGILGNFVGMLTDSRSFLSYARHDYFRRIFCNIIGNWVENGEYPDNEESLRKIVEGVCYKNAARYFGIE
ncbi:MAG: glucuronate isomerase [Eubacteriales bacterium]|nr:glucuronate isomerase [Eubacteriales bacterium]